ncbi:unnamed protein product [Strongylus vulgaris]|uniref:Uncharacterized protein n=1 Tax=Strongylus vulgaris TaxID=40348 RepID=A0A3P7KN53_STRVU|nr:unnamed protein product [Strongylus vulgaris]
MTWRSMILLLGHCYVRDRFSLYVRKRYVQRDSASYLYWQFTRNSRLNFFSDELLWSVVLHGAVPALGSTAFLTFAREQCDSIACGHFYFFLEDVFPYQQHGTRLLVTPGWLKWIFDERQADPVPEEERPGGFGWGVEDE